MAGEEAQAQRHRHQLGDAEEAQLGVRRLDEDDHQRESEDLCGEREGRGRQRLGREARRDADGEEESREQRHEEQLLDRGGPLDEGEVGAAVLEQHGLVDHGQLEVGGGVVDGDAARLGEEHDEERRRGQDLSRVDRGAALRRAPHELAQVERPGREPGREERQHQRGLCQGPDRHLAARAHAPEGAPGVEGGRGQGETAQGEQADQQQDAPRPLQRRGGEDGRQERGCGDSTREVHARPGHENPGRGGRAHGLLAQQLAEVRVGLQQARPLPELEGGLHLLDQPAQQGGEQQEAQGLRCREER